MPRLKKIQEGSWVKTRRKPHRSGVVLRATGKSQWEVVFFDDDSHHIFTSNMLLYNDTAIVENAFTEHNETVVENISNPSPVNNEGPQSQNERNKLPNNHISCDSAELIIDTVENVENVNDYSFELHNLSNTVEENFSPQTLFNSVPLEIEDVHGESYNFLQDTEDLNLEKLDDQQMMEEIPEVDVYKAKQLRYEREKQLLIESGHTFSKKKEGITYIWKIIDSDGNNTCNSYLNDYKNIGLRGFSFSKFDSLQFPYAELFLRLYPSIDWQLNLKQMNDQINWKNSIERKKTKLVSPKEWWTFHAIIFSAAELNKGGEKMFATHSEGLVPPPCFGTIMPINRFKTIRANFTSAFFDLTNMTDPWYRISGLVEAYNCNRSLNVCASRKKTLDESMCSWKPRNSITGGLPNIAYIKRKPKPLGTEFKVAACSVTKCILHLEIQRGKDPMRAAEGSSEHGGTAACSLRLVKGSKNSGQINVNEFKRNIFLGDSWFASTKTAQLIYKEGHEFIGIIKTAHAGYPKSEIGHLMEKWPAGSSIVLETTGPDNIELRAVGYKYNSRQAICFVMTKNAGSTAPGVP